MKKIIINDDKLIEEDIEKNVVRVKGLILNSKGKILLVHNNNTYQFPGGHKEEHETEDDCIVREIRDETGIELDVNEGPFLCIETYDSNYFDSGSKVLNTIYYYRFVSDDVPDFSKTHYDELELDTDFDLFYVNFETLDEFIKEKIESNEIDKKIAREMLYVIDEYKDIYGGIE